MFLNMFSVSSFSVNISRTTYTRREMMRDIFFTDGCDVELYHIFEGFFTLRPDSGLKAFYKNEIQ